MLILFVGSCWSLLEIVQFRFMVLSRFWLVILISSILFVLFSGVFSALIVLVGFSVSIALQEKNRKIVNIKRVFIVINLF